MDTELRQAERSGDYQRMYAILNRCGRSNEARDLILDHPINIDCVVRYRYEIMYRKAGGDNDWMRTLVGYDLDGLLEDFIAERDGASQIISIQRTAVYQLLGGEICSNYFAMDGPLKIIRLSEEETQAIKDRIKAHPRYMQGATQEQINAAIEADSHDAEKARRKIKQAQEQAAALQRKQNIVDRFARDSINLRKEVWALWLEHGKLLRPEFAHAVGNHSLRYVLFKLKDIAEVNTEWGLGGCSPGMGLEQYFSQLWANSYQKRLGIWKRANLI
jgi:hypothetical protein